ncbi:hypothetical protein GCM10009851_29770 [Herbiconiux moechotypicola]|uniref:Uncharacterized protein n=1 Tax=Herbiconiux moechotypicola TaxID=637393 RepID=A0ABN3DVF9_9MICO
MPSAVMTVHQWPMSMTVVTPAAQVSRVISEGGAKKVPTTSEVTTMNAANPMLSGTVERYLPTNLAVFLIPSPPSRLSF